MPLNTDTITIRQIVHDSQGWNSVQVGEMTDLWLKRLWDYLSLNVNLFHLDLYLCMSNRVGVFALNCSLATLGSSSTSSYFPLGLSSKKGPYFLERAPKQYKSRRAFQEKKYCHVLKNKTKHTYFVWNAQSYSAHVVQANPSVLYKLQKSLPVASTGLGKLSFFESVVLSPRTVFIVVPEKNVCQQQSFHVHSVQQ